MSFNFGDFFVPNHDDFEKNRRLLFSPHLTISIRWVTLITEFDTLWLSPGIIETAGSKLINGTLVDRGGSELQY